jgi:PIN domain nuclease of toxin-antitoxin system
LSRYVVDAWAWVEYLVGSAFGAKVKEVIDGDSSEVWTCAVTLAEVISKVAREGRDVEGAYAMLLSNSQIVDADEELSKKAGMTHSHMRMSVKDFGLADAYVLATARQLKAKVLTGDVHFKDVKDAVSIR